MRSGQNRVPTLAALCELAHCLPSELNTRKVSPADWMFAAQYYKYKVEEETRRLSQMYGGGSRKPFGSGK